MSLIHFTQSKESLFSILRYGFLFLHNETGLLKKLLGDLILPEADLPAGGMVCFTDHEQTASRTVRARFGQYGIAVGRQWAWEHGATKVLYVDPDGPVFESFRRIFEESFPEEFRDKNEYPTGLTGIDGLAQSMVLTNLAFLEESQRKRTYVELIRIMSWTQIIADYAQSEWRMRSPVSSSTIVEPMPKEQLISESIIQIERALHGAFPTQAKRKTQIPQIELTPAHIVLALSCPLSPEAIEYICVPADELQEIDAAIQRYSSRIGKPYRGVKVVANC